MVVALRIDDPLNNRHELAADPDERFLRIWKRLEWNASPEDLLGCNEGIESRMSQPAVSSGLMAPVLVIALVGE